MELNLSEKKVLITGSSGQIGTAISNHFLNEGAEVYGFDLNKSTITNKSFHQIIGDVTNEKDIDKVFQNINYDILINNSGISIFSNFLERTNTELDSVFSVNLKSVIKMIIKFSKLSSHATSIVNIASLYGLISPDPRIYTDCERNSPEIYGATKAGIIQITKYYAVHLASKGIRVNSISPGGILNESDPQGKDFIENYSYRTPLSRMGRVDEIAASVIFLSSERASYINGHNLVIDGGFSVW